MSKDYHHLRYVCVCEPRAFHIPPGSLFVVCMQYSRSAGWPRLGCGSGKGLTDFGLSDSSFRATEMMRIQPFSVSLCSVGLLFENRDLKSRHAEMVENTAGPADRA